MDDRTPIVIGVAQVEQRQDNPRSAKEPLQLMIEAVKAAGSDTGNPKVLELADSVRVVRGMWGYANPARSVATRIGAPGAQTVLTSLGGNYVQSLTNRSFLDIQEGKNNIVIITGGECGRTQARARKANLELDWSPETAAPGSNPKARAGDDVRSQASR